MTKDKYDTSKDIDTYMTLANYFMFTQISSKKGIEKFGELSVAEMFKE